MFLVDRDIFLFAVGSLVGLASSLVTLIAVYVLEGMRLRRRWEREDQLQLRQKRAELQQLLDRPGQEPPSEP